MSFPPKHLDHLVAVGFCSRSALPPLELEYGVQYWILIGVPLCLNQRSESKQVDKTLSRSAKDKRKLSTEVEVAAIDVYSSKSSEFYGF